MRKLLPVIMLLAFSVPSWAQCAMCRTALEASAEGRFLASSFANGILLLLFIPYAIFGTISFAIYRAYRNRNKVENS
jgi:hypothetical protein